MRRSFPVFVNIAILLIPASIWAQPAIPETEAGVAARVNGQVIPRSVVERAIERYAPEEKEKARSEVIDFLIDNALVDQYLQQQKVVADEKEIDARMAEIKQELAKVKQSLPELLQRFKMTEPEFRAQITGDLRWEKFTQAQATDEVLKTFFEHNPEMFDGSMVRARHILIRTAAGDLKALETAKAELQRVRLQIEATAAEAVAKLPPSADALTREKERTRQLEEAFSAMAKQKSACPSKRDGGDLNWFPRAGSLVEPFARAAFALKLFEMSQPVQTQFGYHLILAIGRKPGQPAKFEDVKDEVREVYCTRLRETLCTQLRPTAKIVIAPAKP